MVYFCIGIQQMAAAVNVEDGYAAAFDDNRLDSQVHYQPTLHHY